MNEKYQKIFSVLYDQFGDQAIEWTQQQVMNFVDTKFNPDSKASGKVNDKALAVSADEPVCDDESSFDGSTYDDAEYQDGDTFETKVNESLSSLATEQILSPDQVADAVMGLVLMVGEVRKFEEAQVTKRVGIAADRDIALAQIKAQQELLQDYLDRSFDERAENFTKLFAVVDAALDTRDMTALALGLESVVQLATSSPFKDLRTIEETTAALSNPKHEWDF